MIVGATEIAALASVQRTTVERWRQRHPTFPLPLPNVGGRHAWVWSQVQAWLLATGRMLIPDDIMTLMMSGTELDVTEYIYRSADNAATGPDLQNRSDYWRQFGRGIDDADMLAEVSRHIHRTEAASNAAALLWSAIHILRERGVATLPDAQVRVVLGAAREAVRDVAYMLHRYDAYGRQPS